MNSIHFAAHLLLQTKFILDVSNNIYEALHLYSAL